MPQEDSAAHEAAREAVEEMEHQAPDRVDPASQDAPEQAADGGVGRANAGTAAVEEDAGAVEGDAGAVGSGPDTGGQSGTSAAVPATGEPRVDAALKLLERLPGLPVADHAELFEQVHAQLSDVLGELDSGSSGPAGA